MEDELIFEGAFRITFDKARHQYDLYIQYPVDPEKERCFMTAQGETISEVIDKGKEFIADGYIRDGLLKDFKDSIK